MIRNTTLKTTAVLALLLASSLSLTACDADPVTEPNDAELITEVTLRLTNSANPTDVLTIVASDPDGDGAGITFLPTSVALRPGVTYNGTIRLRNTIDNVDIGAEIEEEAEEHLFAYAFSPTTFGAVTLSDRESEYVTVNTNGGDYAVGLRFAAVMRDGISGSGTLNARLYHFDSTPKTGNNATSDEIDIDIDFPVVVSPAPTVAPNPQASGQ